MMPLFKQLSLLFILLLSCSNQPAKLPHQFKGKVVAVKDGDTIEVMYNGKARAIRLADIDCPENSQPYGKTAKQFVSQMAYSKTVTVLNNGKYDRYKRLLATVMIADTINLNLALLKNGLAWHFKKHSKNKIYANAENEARKKQIGLWKEGNAVAPWDWRKKKINVQ